MSKLILPKTYISNLDMPLIFLAGPIRGAPNWQDDAIRFLFSQEKNLAIASPRLRTDDFEMEPYPQLISVPSSPG